MAERDVRTIRILLVEDSDIDAELLTAHLQRARVRVRHRTRLPAAGLRSRARRARLRPDHFRLLTAGFRRSRLRWTAPIAASPETPFIFVSGIVGEEFATNAIRRGASDYILKRNLTRLATSVARALADAQQRAERRAAVTALQASERNLRNALEAGRFGTWTVDLATNELTCSAVCRLNFGREGEAPFTWQDLLRAVHLRRLPSHAGGICACN